MKTGKGQGVSHAWQISLLLIAATLAGCGGTPIPRSQQGATLQSSGGEGDNLSQAIEFLFQLDKLERGQAHKRIYENLMAWIPQETGNAEWIADPLAARLPADLAEFSRIDSLQARKFVQFDVDFLEETVWLHQLAKWISIQGPRADPQLAAWFKEQEASLGAAGSDDLAAADRIFDWTIRSIQLADNRPPVAEKDKPAKPNEAAEPPFSAPPGAQYWPREALFLGRGDALLRARIMIGICRQRGIEAVMLSVFDDKTKSLRPWVVGVMLNKQLYLFDPTLGLPIPGPGGRGIATLAQVQADESLLRALDLSETERYPFTKADVATAVAQIEAAPQHLSLRMKLLERRLTGENRLVLTEQPSEMATRIRQIPGVTEVRLWVVPFQAIKYKIDLASHPAAFAEVSAELQPFSGPLPLAVGRQRHFRGQFQNVDDVLGAKQCYLGCLIPESKIEAISSDEAKKHMMQGNPEFAAEPSKLDAILAGQQKMLRSQRLFGAYYLGLASLDTGEFDVAANHLSKRVLIDYPKSVLESGARYNLARAYEAQGKFDEARKLYEEDDSPQRHGNRLRARWLAAKAKPAEPAPPAAEKKP